jgi:plasmid stabilization system protein ParE
MVSVLWDELALSRHEEWAFSILVEFSAQHMDSYLESIDHALTIIGANPLIGTDASGMENRYLRRFVTSQGYSIFYEIYSLEHPLKVKIISVVRSYA